jgi:hypothetical protein
LGTLSVYQRVITSDEIPAPAVVMGDGTLTLQYYALPPTTEWTPAVVRFKASAGWEIASGNYSHGPAATEAQLQQVLGNLQFLNVNSDWRSYVYDEVDLDRVVMSSVPEPATITLLGLALVGLGAAKAGWLKRLRAVR